MTNRILVISSVGLLWGILYLSVNYFGFFIKKELDLVQIFSVVFNALIVLCVAILVSRRQESDRAIKCYLVKKLDDLEQRFNHFYDGICSNGGAYDVDFDVVVSGFKEVNIALQAIVTSGESAGIKLNVVPLRKHILRLKKLYTSGAKCGNGRVAIDRKAKSKIYLEGSSVSVEMATLIFYVNKK